MSPPLSGDRAYGRLMQSLGRFQGQQRPLKMPITRDLVVSGLRALPGRSPAQQRDCLAMVIATLAGLRPAVGARLRRKTGGGVRRNQTTKAFPLPQRTTYSVAHKHTTRCAMGHPTWPAMETPPQLFIGIGIIHV